MRFSEVEDLSAGRLAGALFKLHPGEVVGVSGVTGSGREDLTQAIFGGIPRARGRVRLAGAELPNLRPDVAVKLGMAYLPPDRKRLGGLMELTARENLTISGLRKSGSFQGCAAALRSKRPRPGLRSSK